ncbi:suppressor of fused domain protein [Chryseobacterium luteum]|uniref:Suppressor of fused-like domain-containing protein n=1 Tax=Chryseobacterium luteum TaxID=421531 RepID=A0A085ZCT5_9FLAO|nr:suppressor of fused domain protein [Chryseobacterium luteum]KFF02249.1 hypothetical protein IX38_13530 [Chryseobacterium luteum]
MDNSKGRLQDFREYIERIFLQDPEIFAFDSAIKTCAPVASFNYENVPEKDYITSITFGVSEFNNPEWTEGRPELMLTVQSTDMNWGKALAFIGAELIEEYNFEYGEVIHFGDQISKDSKMTSFFVFAPSILESDDYENIKIEDRNINLVALYPIYKEEEETIEAVGLEEFMNHPSYDMYSVTRAPIIIG